MSLAPDPRTGPFKAMFVYQRPAQREAQARGGQKTAIRVATDGSSLGNPGEGGWGWYVDEENWAAGAVARATNNQMELRSVLEALRALPAGVDLEIYADSKYTISAVTEWIVGWRRRGWKNSKGDPVANRDLIEAIDAELEKRRSRGEAVKFTHVKGHAGDELNEAVDGVARGASEALRAGEPVAEGPGWTRQEEETRRGAGSGGDERGQGALF